MNEPQPAPRSRASAATTSTFEGCWSVTMEELMADLDPGWLLGAGWSSEQGTEG